MLQLKKKSKPKSDKVATNNNNNNKRPFFLPKINKVFLRPILQNLKGRSVLDNFFLKMILSTSRIRCHQAKNYISSGSWSKTQNGGQNRIYPSLTLLTAKFFPLKRVLKKENEVVPVNQSLYIMQNLLLFKSVNLVLSGHESNAR